MNVKDFNFELPQELIAQTPVEPRDHSRLLVYDRADHSLQHLHFYDLPQFLHAGDALVINETKVIPARLLGQKEDTGVPVELLLLKRLERDVWEALVRPGRRLRPGTMCVFGKGLLRAEIIDNAEDGGRKVRFHYQGVFEEILDRLGQMPLPPYIHEKLMDKTRYQTVYAREEGSAAAPTAGLHFTPELRAQMASAGVEWAEVTLHVGYGTFSPVRCEDIREHVMHEEFVEVPQATVDAIGKAKAEGRPVIAVGTTSARTLEGVAGAHGGELTAHQGWINCFIWPGYRFHVLDGLITNFHLPESTLLMLVSALTGRERMLETYTEAVKMEYRFFSYGDAMLIR